MKGFIVAVMLLAFLTGLGYNTPGYLSKQCDGDPWEDYSYSAQVSQDKDLGDPWSDVTKSPASQKEFQAIDWADDCD